MPAVAGGIDPEVALAREVRDALERGGVEDLHAALVSHREARCRTSRFGGAAGGIGVGRRGRRRGIRLGRAASSGEQGGGEQGDGKTQALGHDGISNH
ncbi:hypothetical protein TPB0596_21480 [Tsukamurella pulmonis]|nr:hypothetical protein TPB0596_21480 [Tsukamurella pulmonis]